MKLPLGMPSKVALASLAACATSGPRSTAPPPHRSQRPPAIAGVVEGLDLRRGLFDIHVDGREGKVWIRLPPPDAAGLHAEFLYLEGLATGLGSNPVGLDRGQLGRPALVRFRRLGSRVLLERPNLRYRASSDDAAEVAATRESFATSILWAADVAAQDDDGSVLLDLTDFLVRDAHGVARALASTGQGSWTLDAKRSVLDPDACLAFPDNLEFEALLTFAGKSPGSQVRSIAPATDTVTLVQHHSFIRLPDDGYRPRRFDPRAGGFAVSYLDYAVGLDQSMDVRLAQRHRLKKTDPGARRSPVREPIVYYVDRGAPEPVRSALLEGAGWWSAAFEAAGFEDAFRVELLPIDAHPLDVRYNVIQWVHRSTRGWSYGNAVSDPRTGEIIKGHVSLGSLRVRQDRLLFEGLAGTRRTGTGLPDDPIELALARIRQLAAHEVGHTLGFAHNFTASTFAGRASVMDYPAPLVRVTGDGELDFSRAYAQGIGAWDEVSVAWLYGQFPPGVDEARRLDAILAEARVRGMRFHSDGDARPPGAAQPFANLWDNFADPLTGLENAMQVRRVALASFGERNLPEGQPLARLEEVLAPVYFHHRYQLEAAIKMLGGVDYDHALNGDGTVASAPIEPAAQRRALALVLSTLEPDELDLPEALLRLLVPRPPGVEASREQFASTTAPAFDALGAAATAARAVADGLLQPERCARLVDQHRRDGDLPSLEEVLESVTDAALAGPPSEEPRLAEIERVVQTVVVSGIVALAGDSDAPPRVRSRAEGRLHRLLEEDWIRREPSSEAEAAHRQMLVADVQRFLHREALPAPEMPVPADPPPGSPIGGASGMADWELCGCSQGH